jgi:uncharacterized membrane protein YeaQ/YmgE (transglycosylase-associated protein family)
MYGILADLVVGIHAAYIAFVIFGLLAILAGYVRKWDWIRNRWFRSIHLAMILIVVAEALMGIVCPLTTLENGLRKLDGQLVRDGSFVGRFIHDLVFYDAPAWIFTLAYCIIGAIVIATFILVPPRLRKL